MLKKLLITGANGNLGAVCRERLAPIAESVRLSARKGLGEAAPHEEIVYCDLSDKDAVEALVDGCDGIVHMGGQATEAKWETIRSANIDGMFNLYEAARKSSVTPRIVFASSNHAIGYHKQTDRLDAKSPTRPDGLYGVSKVFGEAMASMYHDKFGIETACVRIGSCFPEPRNHRMLSTWMSYDDFILMIERIFMVPKLGCPIIYGASANDASWWDNREVAYIGWQPKDNAEAYRAKVDAEAERPGLDDVNAVYHGGAFCADGIHED
ncbi:NAD-dependent epimerase/dehydratase family protein [Oceanomicrobium pacificus]|uniref:NAD-dependent epimerase/dehydratase family protein n=1 Tax=Oceanomicrobium pacificus TaxID=2692916 RepID=A0A6B0TST6_9RHOB|nr:NAD(P)-dependent oxidoreductase [Oceanomicrobium pacificus]MXU64875.1 NAD-dependent epimerase/dehydratase family protein [Oceanomicrobium pacificus]